GPLVMQTSGPSVVSRCTGQGSVVEREAACPERCHNTAFITVRLSTRAGPAWPGRVMSIHGGGVMLVRTLFATCLLLCAMAESAWSSNDMRAEVSCSVLLDALVAKVEANYPGYHIEVRGTPREQAYRQHVSTTAAKRSEERRVGKACRS